MRKTFVKFCGITDPTTLTLAPPGGAVGFVVDVPSSPRSVSYERAQALAEDVPSETEVWAVVVRPSVESVHRLFDEVGVDWIQVHGNVPEGLDPIERHRLVPSMAILPGGSEVPPPPLPADTEIRRLHLDVAGASSPGGTGQVPSWSACASVVERMAGCKVLLGGGLNADNVAEALSTVRPWGVDVSSGIESAPGVKDPERMHRFLEAVDSWESSSHA